MLYIHKKIATFLFLPLLFILIPCLSFAQLPDTISPAREEIEQRIENMAENTDEELDYTELTGQLEYYQKRPLNLNTATAEELQELIILNDVQINNLINHIEKYGNLISIYELQAIDGFTMDAIRNLQPFVHVGDKEQQRHFSFQEMMKYGEHQTFIRYQRILEEQEGYAPITDSALEENPNSRYLGSQDKIYTRYRFKYYRNISWGITAEKDAGEEFFKGTRKDGYDFYSAHLYLEDMGILKAFSLGDYSVQFGQGLTAWSGLAFGKSSQAISIKKHAQGLMSFRSVDENRFLRGSGATIGYRGLEATAFYSNKNVDANIAGLDSVSDEVLYITSLQSSGFHRTPSELEDRDAIGEKIFGGHLAYKTRKLNIGVTAVKTKLDAKLEKQLNNYNHFEFTGKENLNTGLDYSYIFRNFNFFGEIGQSTSGGLGYLNGVLVSLHHYVSASLLHRHYDRDFHGLMSNAFSENSRTIDEDGIYTGLEIKPGDKWSFTAYSDRFKFPWLKYRTSAPSEGYEYFTQLVYTPSRRLEMYLRYRQEDKKANNHEEEDVMEYISKTSKKNIRFNIKYQLSENFFFKNRVAYVDYKAGKEPNSYGYLLLHDIKYRPGLKPYYFVLRYALFDTDTYDSRIYAYENDVLYAYSIPAYFYQGSRYYLLIKYRLTRQVDFWLRFAQTNYQNQNEIGSGKDIINGSTKSEVKAQLRIKF